DLVGRWEYLGDYKTTRIEIEFTPDHKFVQTVTGPGGATKTQHGAWGLDHAYLYLYDVLLNNSVSGFSLSAWNPKQTLWWFTDECGYLELYGGEWSSDPDQCWPLKRLGLSGASSGRERMADHAGFNLIVMLSLLVVSLVGAVVTMTCAAVLTTKR